MSVGYARTSTTEQVAGFKAQSRDLSTVGVERIFAEQMSSVAERPQLEAALDFVRQGDVVVTKLDRLALSVANLLEIVVRLDRQGVTLRILNLGLDTSTPTGKLMLTVMGGVAEFERSIMLERQQESIAKANDEGGTRDATYGPRQGRPNRPDESCRPKRAGHRRGAWHQRWFGSRDTQGRSLIRRQKLLIDAARSTGPLFVDKSGR